MSRSLSPDDPPPRARAVVDLDSITANVKRLRETASGAQVMAVVKADGYGHGLVPSARAALTGGATWLGVALVEEAFALRAAGIDARILAWLLDPAADGDRRRAIELDIDLSASGLDSLAAIVDAARATGRTARVQLKVDTGLGRAGAILADWPDLVRAAAKAQASGEITVTGVWSHLAYADVPHHPTVALQLAAFRDAVAVAETEGLDPEVRHLANSAATLALPETHFDLVRPGIAVYGISPGPEVGTSHSLGLRPAMQLEARFAQVKRVPAGYGVSYGHEYVTTAETTLGLVPLGYADGIPRAASNAGPVVAGGELHTVAGRVCMDQFMVDLGDAPVDAGDEVILFGFGDRHGIGPTADDWAEAAGTIAYEIVTRIGPRVPRVYAGGPLE